MGLRGDTLRQEEQRRLLEFFVTSVTARAAADILSLQANTTVLFFHKIRQVIVEHLDATFPDHGEFEADESYFEGK